MTVDSHIADFLKVLADSDVAPMHEGTPDTARGLFAQMTAGVRSPEQRVPVASVEDRTVAGATGELTARVYRPAVAGPLPTVVFFHGGGWVIGDIETHDNQARSVCGKCDAVVVSVEYRLAPEHPFPAAVEDALAAAAWVAEHLEEFGGDDRLAVAGDSAGGNLAAVVAQRFRDTGTADLAGQFLIYPSVDATGDYPSRMENARGYFLELETMVWFSHHYVSDPAARADPRLSPIVTEDLTGLAPAVVVTGQYDPLRDEGDAYAERLRLAGVPTEHRRYDGMIHGFFDLGGVSPAAQRAVDESCALFARVLHDGSREARRVVEPVETSDLDRLDQPGQLRQVQGR